MSHLAIASLRVDAVRNLSRLELSPSPSVNLVVGDNGAGKTSLLESVYLLCTSMSFRVRKTSLAIAHGEHQANVAGTFARTDDACELFSKHIRLGAHRKTLRMSDKPVRSASAYAVASPAVVFHPSETLLTSGPALLRRRLLDRISCYAFPDYLGALASYTRALRTRQKLLTKGGSDSSLDAWESVLAEAGAVLLAARLDMTARLEPHFVRAANFLLGEQFGVSLRYRATSSPESFSQDLRGAREKDAFRSSAGTGPHRDDLELDMIGRPVRDSASQGQHRALVLALKLAEASLIEALRGARPITLLDDVSSELDEERSARLFAYLPQCAGQIWVSTTRKELLHPLLDGRAEPPSVFHLKHGAVSGVSS